MSDKSVEYHERLLGKDTNTGLFLSNHPDGWYVFAHRDGTGIKLVGPYNMRYEAYYQMHTLLRTLPSFKEI